MSSLTECKQILHKAKRPIVALFANPNLKKYGLYSLGVGNDMQNFIREISPFDFHMEPATTVKQMRIALQKNCPKIICFFGHGYKSGIALEVEKNAPSSLPQERPISPFPDHKVFEVMQADQFADIILECPNVINELKCIALFTCNTSEFANILRTKFPKTYIIFWQTIVTDEASQLFAQGFTAQIAKQISDGFPDIEDAFKMGISSLTTGKCSTSSDGPSCRIGDPDQFRKMPALHYAKVIEDLQQAERYQYPFAQFDYRLHKIIPECTHCFPPVHGIPAMWKPNHDNPTTSTIDPDDDTHGHSSNVTFRPIPP